MSSCVAGILAFLLTWAGPIEAHASQVGQVRKAAVEVTEWMLRACKGIKPARARQIGPTIARELRLLPRELTEHELDEVAKALESIDQVRLVDDDVVRAALRASELGESPARIAGIARRFPHRLAPLSDALADLPKRTTILEALSDGTLSQLGGDLTFRGLTGRQLSKSQVRQLVSEWRQVRPDIAGDMFEAVATRQISRGTMASRLPISPGSRLVAGKYSGAKGIDAIGCTPTGSPCIFEFTISPSKSAGLTDDVSQLSPAGITLRWNELLKRPDRVAELRNIGIDEKFLTPITAETVERLFARKLVVDSPEVLTDIGRQRWGLAMDDMMALNH